MLAQMSTESRSAHLCQSISVGRSPANVGLALAFV